MSFNPGATGILGLEWPVTAQDAFTLDATSKVAAARLVSSGAETIDQLEVYLSSVIGSPKLHAEVYEAGSEVAANKATTRYFPGTDTGATTTDWEDQGGSTVNFGDVDDDDDTSTYATIPAGSTTNPLLFRGAATALSGKRIVKVALGIYQTGGGGYFSGVLNIGGTSYYGPLANPPPETSEVTLATWTLNPATGEPWTLADVNALVAAGATDEFGVGREGLATYGPISIYGMWLDVTYADENRVASGTLSPTGAGWASVSLEEPDGTDNWPKSGSSQGYTITLRRVSSSGSAAWRTLDSGDACPNASHASYQPTADGDGLISATGSSKTAAHALVLVTTSPSDSADSQPYATLSTASLTTSSGATEQEFSGAAAADYDVVGALIRNPNTADADLDIKIRRRSDSAQLGSTVSIDTADIGTDWTRILEKLSTAATLAGATQYYVEFTTTSSTAWEIAYLDTEGNGSGTGYGGTTDRASVDGTDSDDQDFAGTVAAQAPTAPADFAVAASGTPEHAAITWTATSLSGAFLRYEIQRKDATDTTWRTIAKITTEAVEAFADYEGRRGVQSDYRMRVLNTDGVPSDWTATDSLTAAAPSKGWLFVTNESPSLNVNLRTIRDTREEPTFEFPHDRHAYTIEGRDYHVVLSGTEDRGDVFRYHGKITVDSGSESGRAAFDSMEALSKAVLSYVCVLDRRGRRWFASVTLPEGSYRAGERLYDLPVDVVETTITPSTPDAS